MRIYTLREAASHLCCRLRGEVGWLGAEISDGSISTTPKLSWWSPSRKPRFRKAALRHGQGLLGYVSKGSQRTVKHWYHSAVSGVLHSDLPTPKHFQDVVDAMGEPIVPEDTVLGPNPTPYLKAIQTYQENGFDHVYIHQIGPDQEGFIKFFKNELLPLLEKEELVKETI
jgi:hypothetical protein